MDLSGLDMASLGRAFGKKRLELEVDNYSQQLEQMVKERTLQLEAVPQVERTDLIPPAHQLFRSNRLRFRSSPRNQTVSARSSARRLP